MDKELKESAVRIEQLGRELTNADTQVRDAAARVSDLDEKLRVFSNLDRELGEQQVIQDRHAQEYRQFLGARPLATKLDERREIFRKAAAGEASAQELVRQKTEAFAAASREFAPATLEAARNEAAKAGARLVLDEHNLKAAERELEKEKERLQQWRQACSDRDRVEDEASRLKAALEVARLAAKVLKGAAPAVAQHLCSRIAANAQRIFNCINQEAIELEWRAEPVYGLRIFPGERRFAMLSGGEQTKLALAMTLAMIQQFSNLSFALFDEPTYAVDAESRPKLADAILEAQKAAGLDQLILVSHDDAFEGKIENVIVVRKLAGTGTEVLMEPSSPGPVPEHPSAVLERRHSAGFQPQAPPAAVA
jgi:exonuclease SbcC